MKSVWTVAASTTVLALVATSSPSLAHRQVPTPGSGGPVAVPSAQGDREQGWPARGPVGPRPTAQLGQSSYPIGNPYLALLPDGDAVDWTYWQRYAAQASARQAGEGRLDEPLLYAEQEPERLLGGNDRPATAEPIVGFGTGAGDLPGVTVLGHQATDEVRLVKRDKSAEDNGSIPRAQATGIVGKRPGIRTVGRIGDGPHGAAGSGSGDFDYYRVRVPQGRQIVAEVNARDGSDLEPLVAVWGEKGALKDVAFPRRDRARLVLPLRAGTYFVMVGGCCTYPRNRFDSGSGTGAESEGSYRFSVAVNRPDRDFFAVDLRAGDVLGGTLDGARSLAVYDPDGTKVFGSFFDASFIYPASTPLPGGGRAVVDHVAATSGRYTVEVTRGSGDYRADLEAYRPGLATAGPGARQTLFLDFDGARLNTGLFGGGGVSELSPLSAFLGRWGLRRNQEDAVIDAVVASVRESVRRDLVAQGLNDDFGVRIRNSRDHPDPWGQDNVSRVIVGGTIAESGVFTIGIAQSIDPGNFDQEETALLLLDLLSGPPRDDFSINHYLEPQSDRVRFVGQVLGNLVSHEAGHYLGNWHVDQFDGRPNLMDQGGNARAIFGPGPDGVGGTADDRDVDFGVNRLNPFEGFQGLEDTLNRTAFGLTVG